MAAPGHGRRVASRPLSTRPSRADLSGLRGTRGFRRRVSAISPAWPEVGRRRRGSPWRGGGGNATRGRPRPGMGRVRGRARGLPRGSKRSERAGEPRGRNAGAVSHRPDDAIWSKGARGARHARRDPRARAVIRERATRAPAEGRSQGAVGGDADGRPDRRSKDPRGVLEGPRADPLRRRARLSRRRPGPRAGGRGGARPRPCAPGRWRRRGLPRRP